MNDNYKSYGEAKIPMAGDGIRGKQEGFVNQREQKKEETDNQRKRETAREREHRNKEEKVGILGK